MLPVAIFPVLLKSEFWLLSLQTSCPVISDLNIKLKLVQSKSLKEDLANYVIVISIT